MRLVPFIALALVVLQVRTARCEVRGDSERIQGTWIPSTAELGGKPFPDEARKTIKLSVQRNKYTVLVGKNADRGTIKLNAAAKPKTLDVIGTEGPNKGKTILAIYELGDDSWTIYYDLSGKSRPKEFKTRKDSQLFLVSYKRETRKSRE